MRQALQLLLALLVFGDVLGREQPARLVVVIEAAQRLQQGAHLAVAPAQLDFVVGQGVALAQGGEHLRAVFGGEETQLHRAMAHGLGRAVARERLPGGVDVLVMPTAAVHHAHGLLHELEDAREMLLGLAQLHFGELVVVDVLHHAAHALQAPVFHHRLAVGTHPDEFAVAAHNLQLHRPIEPKAQAVGELVAQRLAPGQGDVGVGVVAWQRRAQGQAVDGVAHVRPVDDALVRRQLPGAQACQAPGLQQQAVEGL